MRAICSHIVANLSCLTPTPASGSGSYPSSWRPNTQPYDFNLDCRYVERELDPRTTRQGVLETGEPATSSDTGGIDLLLAHTTDALPIIGEVKIGRDTNPFFGLVQALTYAVELCTTNQYQRLRESFPERFKGLAGKPRADVYLLLKDCPEDELHKRIQHDTEILVKGMYGDKSVASVIRRIVCLEVTADRPESLNLIFRFGSGEGMKPFPPHLEHDRPRK